MLPAYRDVGFISAHHDLLSGTDHLSILDPRVEDCLLAAPADGGNLFQAVCDFEETLGAFKQVAGEVGAKSVADDGDIELVHDPGKGIDLFCGEELCLVHDQAVDVFVLIGFTGEPFLFSLLQNVFHVVTFRADADS